MLQPKDIDWLNGYKNKTPYICCPQETHHRIRDTCRLKVRGWKKDIQSKRKSKKDGVSILISDKIDFKKRLLKETKKDIT